MAAAAKGRRRGHPTSAPAGGARRNVSGPAGAEGNQNPSFGGTSPPPPPPVRVLLCTVLIRFRHSETEAEVGFDKDVVVSHSHLTRDRSSRGAQLL